MGEHVRFSCTVLSTVSWSVRTHLLCLLMDISCSIRLFVGSTGLPIPKRPKPLYSFFPIYSPFKVDDNDGFDLGEDNKIKSMYINDGALQFEVRVLAPFFQDMLKL